MISVAYDLSGFIAVCLKHIWSGVLLREVLPFPEQGIRVRVLITQLN